MKRDIFQAIADPTRRAIIMLVTIHAMTPNEIAMNFDKTRQAVSKHIKILNESGMLEKEIRGREIYYSLKVEKMKEFDLWLEQFRQVWENKFDKLEKILIKINKGKNKNEQ